MTTEEIINEAMQSMKHLTIKSSLFKVAMILDSKEAIKVLREVADDIEAELKVFGEAKK